MIVHRPDALQPETRGKNGRDVPIFVRPLADRGDRLQQGISEAVGGDAISISRLQAA